MFFQRLDRDVVTSQPGSLRLRMTFVGCVIAMAAVGGAGVVVGETSAMSRSARENGPIPGPLAPGSVQALRSVRTKAAPKVNVGSATQFSADATVVVANGVDPELVNRVLQTLTVDWRSIAGGWSIVFKKERNGYLGLTLVREQRVEIYVRSGRPVSAIAHDLAHELGHVADVTAGSTETRSAYLAVRDLRTTTPWWTCSGCTDLQVGAGDFAETFALLAAPPFRFYSELGNRPSDEQLQRVVGVLPESVVRALRRPEPVPAG